MSTIKTDNDDIDFGAKIKHTRKIRRVTQEKLAQLLDISKDYVSRIEKGERKPATHLKKAIEQWLNNESEGNNDGLGRVTSGIPEHGETREDTPSLIRNYRDLAEMDADTLGEIQTWLNDMERFRPGFSGWFRLEFQNRFPEFDDWKNLVTKKRTGTSD